MWKAIKANFGSVWGIMGIIVGAISLINLGVMYFDVGIGPVLERIVETYRSIVHRGFDILFFWVDWQMPAWAKDVTTIYAVFAVATLRSELLVNPNSKYMHWYSLFLNHFFLWWRTAFRCTRAVFLFWKGDVELIERERYIWEKFHRDNSQEFSNTFDGYLRARVRDTWERFWVFWIGFVSIPLAAFCFIVMESGL